MEMAVEYRPAANPVADPICSVCIANYNGIQTIDDCIDSVLSQDFELPVEIIIHDDASTDTSVEHIKENYPDIELLISGENKGFCISNNRMAEIAKGKYILLLNNDAALWPNALTTLHDAAQNNETPSILSLPQYDFDSGKLIDIGCLLDPFFNPVPNRDPKLSEVGMVIGACLWIPKELWDGLGRFPEWFGSIGEDLYLCCRARLSGHPIRAIGISGYRHKVGASFGGGKTRQGQLSTTYRRRALSERNKTFVMIICQPTLLLVVLLPLHLILIHLEGLLLSVIKRDITLWREIYAPLLPNLWCNLDRLLIKRSNTQSKRKITLLAWLKPFQWSPYKLRMLFRHGLPELK
jgi:GT2 family glycosyltransferase